MYIRNKFEIFKFSKLYSHDIFKFNRKIYKIRNNNEEF